MKSFALYASDPSDAWTRAEARGNGEPADYTSREGAMALKAKIEAYWRERGQDVMLSLHNVGFHPAIRAARFDVRSDMVNGLPRASLTAPGAAKAPQREAFTVSLVETETDDDDTWID